MEDQTNMNQIPNHIPNQIPNQPKQVKFNSVISVREFKKPKSEQISSEQILDEENSDNQTFTDPTKSKFIRSKYQGIVSNDDTSDSEEHLIINKDPTDILDVEETEINHTESDTEKETDPNPNDIHINRIMNIFLSKYEHLDNFKNKKIIYSMCEILVNQIPDKVDNPQFFMNLLESLISDITSQSNQTYNDIVANNNLDDE